MMSKFNWGTKDDPFFNVPTPIYDSIFLMSHTEIKVTLAIVRYIKEERLTRSQLMKITGLSKNSVRSGLDAISKRGLIGIHQEPALDPEMAFHIISSKAPQRFALPGNRLSTCTWCNGSTLALHAHHYPIPRSKGGTKTVNICPNCHAEYHVLTEEKYSFFLVEEVQP